MIEAQSLTRRYGDFAAVDNVSFQIQPGEVVGLLGHNGAGKTTIMKMLTGFLEPSSGQALVGGVTVENEPMRVQTELGYLPENLPLYPEMSVADYLTYVANLRQLDASQVVPKAIAATELQAKALDTIDTLSRGYKQRVGVAQAIIHEPAYLILDEPTNGLDPSQTLQMRRLITRLAERSTVILSTHIMQEVDAICDRAIILRGGRLVFDERLDALGQAGGLRLRVDATASLDGVLSGIEGLGAVTPLGDGEFALALSGDANAIAAAAVAALAQRDIRIYEIAPNRRDLEQVFREVNERDEEGVNHAA